MKLKLSNCEIEFHRNVVGEMYINIEYGNTTEKHLLGEYDSSIEYHRNFALALNKLFVKLKEYYQKDFNWHGDKEFKINLSDLQTITFLTIEYINNKSQILLEKSVRETNIKSDFRYNFQYLFDKKVDESTKKHMPIYERHNHFEKALNYWCSSREKYTDESNILSKIDDFLIDYFKHNL